VAVMDSPTIRQLRTEWQALGTAPPSSAACHRLVKPRPDDADTADSLCRELKCSRASDCVRGHTEDPLPLTAGQRSHLTPMLSAYGAS
jgi:hypothetical protein